MNLKITICPHGVDQRMAKCMMCEPGFTAAAAQAANINETYVTGGFDLRAQERRIRELETALRHYTHCRHACIDCNCTKEAKAALY